MTGRNASQFPGPGHPPWLPSLNFLVLGFLLETDSATGDISTFGDLTRPKGVAAHMAQFF